MKPERFKRTKSVVASSAIALVVAAATFGLASVVVHPSTPRFSLTGGSTCTSAPGFCINVSGGNTISSTPTPTFTTATLNPGVHRYLWYYVTNPQNVSITVTSLKILSVTPPTGCDGSNLDLSQTTFTGPPPPAVAPAAFVVGGNSTSAVSVPISFNDKPHINQGDTSSTTNNCENKTFNFAFTGSAQYTEVYDTTTAVTSSVNPSTLGNSVTYTATVSAHQGSQPDPVPSSPTGSVTFYDGTVTPANAIAGCSGRALPLSSAGTTTATATCASPVYGATGTHSITAVFTDGADGNFTGSTSPVFTQTVNDGTTTALTSAPNPSELGNTVTLTATVSKSSGSGTPTGTVAFHLGSPTGAMVGTGGLSTSAVATITTSSLPAGADNLYAVYGGATHFSGSTSTVRVQTVIGPPAMCSGSYPSFFYGNPAVPVINGTNGNDFIYAFGANYVINGNQGNDCLVAGDGNNVITDGNGADFVIGGNGTNTITVGNGTDNVTVGNGVGNVVFLGNGADTVTVTSPTAVLTNTHDTITGGQGNEIIFLGSGSHNIFTGGKGKNTCHLPTPPPAWHGTAAAYYNDTITNCTVVTP